MILVIFAAGHSYQIARCGNHNGSVVNPDSGRPIVFDDERLLRDDFGKQERFAETLESVALCGGEKTKGSRNNNLDEAAEGKP